MNQSACNNCPRRTEGCHVGCTEGAVEDILRIIQKSQKYKGKREQKAVRDYEISAVARMKRGRHGGKFIQYATSKANFI